MEKYYEIRLSSIGIAIAMIVLGVLLTIYPGVSGTIFTRGFAAVVLILALSHAWKGLRARKHHMGGNGNLAGAAVFLILSGISFFKPEFVLSFLPFVTGALLILDGLVKIPLVKSMWNWGGEVRGMGILSAVLPLLLGIFLAAYPFEAAAAAIRIFGIFLLLDGCSDVLRNSMVKRAER